MVGKKMNIKGNKAYISREEVILAFFRTEEEENEGMAIKLNEMINIFCKSERKERRNIPVLPFDVDSYKSVIEYIKLATQQIFL